MQAKLKQAIAATRSGNKKEAQLLLTQVLRDDPEEVQAWYLLSLLVDDEDKQIAYLSKVVTLDPEHEKAQARLLQLQPVLPPPDETAVEEPPVLQEERPLPAAPPPTELQTDDAMPGWLTDEPEESAAPVPAEESTEAAELPDWLDEMPPPTEEETPPPLPATEDQPTLVSSEAPEPIETAAAPPAEEPLEDQSSGEDIPVEFADTEEQQDRQQQLERLNRLLLVLIAGAVIFFLMLLYMLVATFLG